MTIGDATASGPSFGDTQQIADVVRLAGAVAHDFNNLLAIIIGNVELLAEDMPPDSELLAMLELIRSAAERGEELADGLLRATEPLMPDEAGLRLSAIAERVAASLAGPQGRPTVRLAGSSGARLDERTLESALRTFCTTACTSMQAGDRIVVEVTCDPAHGEERR